MGEAVGDTDRALSDRYSQKPYATEAWVRQPYANLGSGGIALEGGALVPPVSISTDGGRLPGLRRLRALPRAESLGNPSS